MQQKNYLMIAIDTASLQVEVKVLNLGKKIKGKQGDIKINTYYIIYNFIKRYTK
jgi:hypothetical protein